MTNVTSNGSMRRLTASDGHHFDAWEVLPPPDIALKNGIVVLRETFGLTNYIHTVCANLAAEGYHVIAPTLFRVAPNSILPSTKQGLEENLTLQTKLSDDEAEKDIDACVKALQASHNIKNGVMGFSWGGLLAWQAAQQLDIQAAVGWYGGGIAATCNPAPLCPVELHFGAEDPIIPPSDWEQIRNLCPNVSVYVYDGAKHSFGCIERNSFNRKAHDLAWERSIAFFKKTLLRNAAFMRKQSSS